jgi:DNA topoisomerase-1
VPKAWTNVRLSADPQRELQVTGKDSKGRTQYKYSDAHTQASADAKFSRGKEFHHELPAIRDKLSQDMKSNNPRVAANAAVISLIDATGFRIGSNKDTGTDEKHYGISTLTKDHVKVNGDQVTVNFTGKAGKANEKTIENPELAKYIGTRMNQTRPGESLFNTDDNKARLYMHGISEGFTPKDFRTWHGTNTAMETIKSMPTPKTDAQYRKAMNAVGDAVAAHLGNTRAVALKSYIDPAVFGPWSTAKTATSKSDGSLMDELYGNDDRETTDWRSFFDDNPEDPEELLSGN